MRAWPRSDVTCDGVAATCSFVPQAIIDAQVLTAYNLLINPDMITGSPGVAAERKQGPMASQGWVISKSLTPHIIGGGR